MASVIPPILVEIQADIDNLKKGLTQAQQSLNQTTDTVKKADSSFSSFVGRMKQVGLALGATFAASTVVNFAKSSVLAASDMSESLSKVNVVFGQNANAITSWSTQSATAMGMSQQKALEAAGTYGNLFQALGVSRDKATEMSKSLVQLAADLASFNNASPEETLQALRSGLSGETEPLKRFGVALNDVTIRAKAAAMGFGEFNGTIPPAIKSQVTYALVLEQTKLAQGDYARTADGAANTMRTLKARLDDAKVALGNALLPALKAVLVVLNLLIPVLTKIGDFFVKNREAIRNYAILVGTLTAAFIAYRTVINGVRLAQEAYAVTLVVMRAGTLASIAATNGLAASMLKLRAAMLANPIGLIVAAVMLVGAAFIYAWNKSEKFRDVVRSVVSAIIGFLSKLLGAMATVLEKASQLPIVGEKFKGIASAIRGASSALDSYATKIATVSARSKSYFSYMAEKGGVAQPFTTEETTTETTLDGGGTGKKKTDSLAAYLTTVRNKIADARKKYNDALADAYKDYTEKTVNAETELTERRAEIQARFQETVADLTKRRAQQTLDLEKANAQKIIEIQKDATARLADIVQKSMDRLRSAFTSGTATNIADMFKSLKDAGEQGAAGLLDALKKRLTGAKTLAENASKLAGLGFSQTFIEQIVSQGPEVGNEIATTLLGGDPAVIAELRSTFSELERLSENGMDALAKTIYEKSGLATTELKNMYAETQQALADSLTAQKAAYAESMEKINTDFNEAFADAEKTRDTSLAEAQLAFNKAIEAANKELSEKLADAFKTLTDTLDKIQRDFLQKMKTFKDEVKAMMDQIQALLDLIAQLKATPPPPIPQGPVPYVPPTVPSTIPQPDIGRQMQEFREAERNANLGNVNKGRPLTQVTVNALTNASASSIAKETVIALQYGIPLSTAQAGFVFRNN